MSAPRVVENALGTVVAYLLGQGGDVDGGVFIDIGPVSMGVDGDQLPLGHWRFEIRRTAKPETPPTPSARAGEP